MAILNRWEEGRPIYYLLPGENEGFLKDPEFNDPETDPPIAEWLTRFWDELLLEQRAIAERFYQDYLDPATCLPEALTGWLAQHFGYTGAYWDDSWSVEAKRALLSNAYQGVRVWESKGTETLFYWLLDVFELEAQIYRTGSFLVGVSTLPAEIGGEPYRFYVTTGLQYLRTSLEWARLEQLRRLFTPAYCESLVCYEQFYAGFSLVGDPVFELDEVGGLAAENRFDLLNEDGTELLIDDVEGIGLDL